MGAHRERINKARGLRATIKRESLADYPEDLVYLDDEEFTCWCGERGPYRELCEPVGSRCGGHGTIDCLCGGDFCVCHNHGSVECLGCVDCERDVDDQSDADWDWYEGDEIAVDGERPE